MLPEKEGKKNNKIFEKRMIKSQNKLWILQFSKLENLETQCPLSLYLIRFLKKFWRNVCMYLYCETFWQDPFDKLLHNGSKSFIEAQFEFILVLYLSEIFIILPSP